MILKNKKIMLVGNAYGKVSMSVSDKDDNYIGSYKFDGHFDGVDLEISIPKGCRTEYAKIIKVK
jgi:hypothetical protein